MFSSSINKMKKLLIVVIILSSCSQQDLSKQAATEITDADKAMSAQASKDGFFKTLLEYADDSVIKPQEGNLPVIGKESLIRYWSGKTDFTNVAWEPFRAEAAKAGDMGYTIGNWKMITKDTILYGNYYTVWKKQKDGRWKFVVDGGNNTPPPK
jgi:ketosteroid isomerase-like protein